MTRLAATSLSLALVMIAGCAGHGAGPRARPQAHFPEIELTYFYQALEPYGFWLSIDPYGWVWQPAGMAPYWRPYTDGYWVWTNYGWTWVSDWRWGWAPFHYGRWMLHAGHGWVWVPGRTWGPAWVAWRDGPGWIGWAPLPPGVSWGAGVGLDLGGARLDALVGFDSWVFVGADRFLDRRLARHVLPLERNQALVRDTRSSARYSDTENDVVNYGIARERVERAVGREVPVVTPQEVESPPRRPTSGDRVKVYKPRVSPAEPQAPPAAARRTRPPRSKPPAGKPAA